MTDTGAMNGLLEALLPLAAVAIGVASAVTWLGRTRDTGISLFRPYRDDGWPIGVQEDDDVHFDWTPPPASPGPTLDLVVDLDREAAPAREAPAIVLGAQFEDAVGDDVRLERPRGLEIHRAGR